MVRAMDSPMPMPSALLVKNGSKTSFNLTSGMPEPRSDTDSWAKFSTREVRMLMKGRFFQQAPHSPDDFAGALVIPQDIDNNLVQFRNVRARRFQNSLCGFGIGKNRPRQACPSSLRSR